MVDGAREVIHLVRKGVESVENKYYWSQNKQGGLTVGTVIFGRQVWP